jgi:hypothetical protein
MGTEGPGVPNTVPNISRPISHTFWPGNRVKNLRKSISFHHFSAHCLLPNICTSVADTGCLSRTPPQVLIFFHPKSGINQKQKEEGENLFGPTFFF